MWCFTFCKQCDVDDANDYMRHQKLKIKENFIWSVLCVREQILTKSELNK